jgi:hypothetical protein
MPAILDKAIRCLELLRLPEDCLWTVEQALGDRAPRKS